MTLVEGALGHAGLHLLELDLGGQQRLLVEDAAQGGEAVFVEVRQQRLDPVGREHPGAVSPVIGLRLRPAWSRTEVTARL